MSFDAKDEATTTIITEDGIPVHKGDAVYNYYDMEPGIIETDPDHAGWFRFRSRTGSPSYLNGQRICSMSFAIRRGFRNA